MLYSFRHCACALPFTSVTGGFSWSTSGKVLTVVSSRTGFFSRSPKSSLNLEDVKAASEESAGGSEQTALEKAESTSVVTRGPLPIITKRELNFLPKEREPRQAWVENLDTIEEKKLGLIDLHPDVWATFPRIELLHANIHWQSIYRKVNWDWEPTRGEMYATKKKPWPQKGLGKARHGSTKSPIWLKGAKAKGPRGPKTHFFMLPFWKRVNGLCSALSVKLAQDDLKIVDSLDIPRQDPKYLNDLITHRSWGLSVLFVDDTDIAPVNLAMATDNVGEMNIMPVYGLNVYSMLKHDTLVLTVAAVNKIEEKLIMHLNRHDPFPPAATKFHHGQAV